MNNETFLNIGGSKNIIDNMSVVLLVSQGLKAVVLKDDKH